VAGHWPAVASPTQSTRIKSEMETNIVHPARQVAFLAALIVLAAGSATAQPSSVTQDLELTIESEPVLTMGDVTITHAELDAHMQRLPKEDRAEAVSDMERIDKLLQSLLMKKALYEAARDDEIHRDPTIAFRALYAAADILADAQMDRHVESQLLEDYERRARELFLSDPDQFRGNPTYSFTHVLVSTGNRSEAEAMRRILEVHEQVNSGKNLEALVSEFSEDNASVENGGAYEKRALDSLDRNFARALSGLASPGDVSGPVRSRFGWHIVRLDERHEPPEPEWEDVRERAIETARRQHENRIREAYASELLDSDAIEVVPGSIERFQKRHGFEPGDSGRGTSD